MQILHNKQSRWALYWLGPDVFRWLSLILPQLRWEYLKSGSKRFWLPPLGLWQTLVCKKIDTTILILKWDR